MKRWCLVLCVGLCWAAISFAAPSSCPVPPELQVGDLLFQDLNCGALCDAIDVPTEGVGHTHVSHVAMVVRAGGSPMVVEAVSPIVRQTRLSTFLNRSLDKNGCPRVVVERVRLEYQPLVDAAVLRALQQVGQPYNSAYSPNFGGFYCSQLIAEAFKNMLTGLPLFSEYPMSFDDPLTFSVVAEWRTYFRYWQLPVPDGESGSNPGAMSRSVRLVSVGAYGRLRPLRGDALH